jgi:hypothetical protein
MSEPTGAVHDPSSELARSSAGSNVAGRLPGPISPPDEAAPALESTLALDEIVGRGIPAGEQLHSHVTGLRAQVFTKYPIFGFPPEFSLRRAWPSSLYVPTKVKTDWAFNPFLAAPPDENLYKEDWVHHGGAPATSASKDTGELFSYQACYTTDRTRTAEAGLGIVFEPEHLQSVISFTPELRCQGQHRLHVDLFTSGFIIARTRVQATIFLAAWEISPYQGAVELIQGSVRRHVVFEDYNDGPWPQQIQSTSRIFNPGAIETKVLVQKAHRYLLGVVGRIFFSINITTSQGNPVPHPQDGSVKLWGFLACQVPSISVTTTTIYQ